MTGMIKTVLIFDVKHFVSGRFALWEVDTISRERIFNLLWVDVKQQERADCLLRVTFIITFTR